MDRATKLHLGGGAFAAILSGLTWWYAWPVWVAILLLITADVYLLTVLVEVANRSAKERHVENGFLKRKVPRKVPWKIEIPEPSWSILQAAFVILTAVTGFAALYIHSGDILFLNATTVTDRIDAIYYSVVTMTTLGYGDMAPAGHYGRLLVMWQLATGMLLLFAIFPLLMTRVAAHD